MNDGARFVFPITPAPLTPAEQAYRDELDRIDRQIELDFAAEERAARALLAELTVGGFILRGISGRVVVYGSRPGSNTADVRARVAANEAGLARLLGFPRRRTA